MSDSQSPKASAIGYLIIAFTDETAADKALLIMQEAKKQKQFYFESAAVIRQDGQGNINFKETDDKSTGKGAGTGALIGGVLGILGGPVGVALGASVGAAVGAAATHGDTGFRDDSLKRIGVALRPGSSAVTAITSSAALRSVQKRVPEEDIRRFVSSLAGKISARLDEGQCVALGILLTERGLAAKEVAVTGNSGEVVAMAIADKAVFAAGLIATDTEAEGE